MTIANLSLIGALTAGAASGLLATLLFQAVERGEAGPQPLALPPETETNTYPATKRPDPALTTEHAPSAKALQLQLEVLAERNTLIERQLSEMQTRLEAIESAAFDAGGADGSGAPNISAPAVQANESQGGFPQTLSTLLEIGVDEHLARDISRREDALEMQRLELRDQAIRDGSYGSASYREQLRTLSNRTPQIRDEIGDTAYDRYLYAMGRSNRVAVASVMSGSPAEQSGLTAGDIILNYAGRPIYHSSELSEATSGGERGEYVQIQVQRNTGMASLLVPRGPLGVRMRSIRLRPEID